MKALPLKKFNVSLPTEKDGEKAIETSTYKEIRNILNAPLRGIKAEDMRKRLKLLDLFDKAKDADAITLEDADFDYLKELVSETEWLVVDKNILDLIDSFEKVTATV